MNPELQNILLEALQNEAFDEEERCLIKRILLVAMEMKEEVINTILGGKL